MNYKTDSQHMKKRSEQYQTLEIKQLKETT